MFRYFLLISCFLCSLSASADEAKLVKLLWQNGAPYVTPDSTANAETPFAIASIGKLMTAVSILKLAEEKALSLNDLASEWLELKIVKNLKGLEDVTIRHLLSMSSGLAEYLSDDYLEDLRASPHRVQNAHKALSYAFSQPAKFKPGSRFDYCHTNYLLLGIILENATHSSYGQALRRYIFEPTGMRQSFVFGTQLLPLDFPNGHEDSEHQRHYDQVEGFGDGGVVASAADVGRFYQALFIDKKLLSKNSLLELLHDRHLAGYGMGVEIEGPLLGHSGEDVGFSADVRLVGRQIAVMLVAEANASTSWTRTVFQGH